MILTVNADITGINFCWYEPDMIYVQFSEIVMRRCRKHDKQILAELNRVLGGRVTAVDITSDDTYCQAFIRETLSLAELQALGYPVSDES